MTRTTWSRRSRSRSQRALNCNSCSASLVRSCIDISHSRSQSERNEEKWARHVLEMLNSTLRDAAREESKSLPPHLRPPLSLLLQVEQDELRLGALHARPRDGD